LAVCCRRRRQCRHKKAPLLLLPLVVPHIPHQLYLKDNLRKINAKLHCESEECEEICE